MRSGGIVVIGGGAAGFFAAIRARELAPHIPLTLLEATAKPLAKVRISGGGRCNVTHACFDPAQLVKHYPRGARELRGPFSRFQPRDTVTWFESRGVPLKVESDGRIFPQSNSSESVARCLEREAARVGVEVVLKTRVREICAESEKSGFLVRIQNHLGEAERHVSRVLLATGGGQGGFELAHSLGHTIEPPVPSLFTFVVNHPLIDGLSGVSVSTVRLTLEAKPRSVHRSEGPILVTHWGLSGPAVLKLSAFAARDLHEVGYSVPLHVNWLGEKTTEEALRELQRWREEQPRKRLCNAPPFSLPARLWERVLLILEIDLNRIWGELHKRELSKIGEALTRTTLPITGKGQFKEEFVTAGGVRCSEVEWKTFESRIVPGLFFAGEILDVDGVTGGFNFQNAWTTGWLAGSGLATGATP